MDNHTDPIQTLMKEHDIGLKYLQRLGDAAEDIRTNGFSFEAFKHVAEAIQFIDTEIRQHNEKEEKYLFPLMERHVDGPPAVMRGEHRKLWRAFSRLRECVKDVEEMRIYPSTVRDLVECSKTIVQLLSDHIAKENDVLFPMAKEILTKDEYRQLTREIAAVIPMVLRNTIS